MANVKYPKGTVFVWNENHSYIGFIFNGSFISNGQTFSRIEQTWGPSDGPMVGPYQLKYDNIIVGTTPVSLGGPVTWTNQEYEIVTATAEWSIPEETNNKMLTNGTFTLPLKTHQILLDKDLKTINGNSLIGSGNLNVSAYKSGSAVIDNPIVQALLGHAVDLRYNYIGDTDPKDMPFVKSIVFPASAETPETTYTTQNFIEWWWVVLTLGINIFTNGYQVGVYPSCFGNFGVWQDDGEFQNCLILNIWVTYGVSTAFHSFSFRKEISRNNSVLNIQDMTSNISTDDGTCIIMSLYDVFGQVKIIKFLMQQIEPTTN